MRGGKIIAESRNPKYTDPLHYYVEHSMIHLFAYDSLYGIILKLQYTGEPKKCPYLIVDETGTSHLKQMILKLSVIVDMEKNDIDESKSAWIRNIKEQHKNDSNKLNTEYYNLPPREREQDPKLNNFIQQLEDINKKLEETIQYIHNCTVEQIARLTPLEIEKGRKITKRCMTTPMFDEEVKRQFKLVGSTIQLYEPICPSIVYKEVEKQKQRTVFSFSSKLFGKNIIFSALEKYVNKDIGGDPKLKNVFEWMSSLSVINKVTKEPLNYQIGIIGMELMEGYDTFYSYYMKHQKHMIEKYPMYYDEKGVFNNVQVGKNALESPEYKDFVEYYNTYETQMQTYLNFAVYELVRLGSLGYIHGDSHMNNILIHPTIPYFEGVPGRAMLIDFGRTKKMTDAPNYVKTQCIQALKNGDVNTLEEITPLLLGERLHDYYGTDIGFNYKELKQLVLGRNAIIDRHLQDAEYVKKANDSIQLYNRTIYRRLRSWKSAILDRFVNYQAPRLNKTRKKSSVSASRVSRVQSLSNSPRRLSRRSARSRSRSRSRKSPDSIPKVKRDNWVSPVLGSKTTKL